MADQIPLHPVPRSTQRRAAYYTSAAAPQRHSSTDFEEALHSCGNCSKGPDVTDTYKSVEVKSLRSLICRKLSHAYTRADFA